MAVRFLLPDETIFTLGPNSDMTFDHFVYDPNTSASAMTANVAKGIFRFVTGKFSHTEIPGGDPQSKSIKIAVGTIGCRGTDMEVFFDDNNDMLIYAYDGEISFTPKDGVIWYVPVGYFLTVPPSGIIMKRPEPFNGGTALLDVTDKWDDSLMDRAKETTGRQ